MTAEQFINNYNTAVDKNKFLSDCITTKYVKYTEKVADCRKIVNITFEIMGDKKFCVDSPAQFVIFVMNLIYRYTDIDRSEMVVTDFESLDEINLVNEILEKIPERELSSYNTILNMCKDDYISNNRDLVSFLETKIDSMSASINAILEAADIAIKDLNDKTE